MHHFNWSSTIIYTDWFAFILYGLKSIPMPPSTIGWLIGSGNVIVLYSERQLYGGTLYIIEHYT